MTSSSNYMLRIVLLSSLIALAVCARPRRSNNGGFFQRFRPSSPTKRQLVFDKVWEHRKEVEQQVNRLSKEVNDLARQRGSSLKDAAVQTAESKRRHVEREAQRLTHEVETLTRQKADEYEAATRRMLSELERAATQELQRLAVVADQLAQEKAAQAEASAKRRLVEMEQAATRKVTAWIQGIGQPTKKPTKTATAKILPASVSGPMLAILRVLVLVASIGNTLGYPPEVVLDLWEKQGFGDEFFPFEMSITNKRVLAGGLEFCGFLLLTLPAWTPGGTTLTSRTVGAALIAAMFSRGSILNAKRETWQMLVPGVVACLAVTLFLNDVLSELRGPPPNNKTKNRRRRS